MICIVALIVFSILGIFSAKYRVVAKEAFDCVFRRLTLRKCETGLDKRLKAQITGKLMKRWPRAGKQIYKHFEVLSWIFLILLLTNIFFAGDGIYNAIKYGNCNGPGSTEFCPFNPAETGGGVTTIRASTELNSSLVTPEGEPWFGNPNAPITIIEFGCFKCTHTKKAAETIVKDLYLENRNDIYFVYKDFPLSTHEHAEDPAIAADCVYNQSRTAYWDFYFKLFENQDSLDYNTIMMLAEPLGINMTEFQQCFESQKPYEDIKADYDEGFAAGIYGTPTFFINGEPVVGPDENQFNRILKKY